MNEEQMIEQIKQQGMLPLFYSAEKEQCISIAKTMYGCGINIIEFTNRGETALANFEALVAVRNKMMPDLLLAAGTIKTATQANGFIKAGADFLISPVFDDEVCDAARLHKKLWIPGCMTPTEIYRAESAGCKLIKLFPGNVLGPGFVKAIKELFPAVEFMPTGGVDTTKENICDWFKADVCAVGIGSKLIDYEVFNRKNYELLAQRVKEVKSIVDDVKRG